MVRMILPRATPGRAVPPPHLFEAGPLQLQPFLAEQFSFPLLFCLRQAPTTYFTCGGRHEAKNPDYLRSTAACAYC